MAAGALIQLRAGRATAAVDAERGGRLSSLAIAGRELLVEAPDSADRSILWGCFLMAPWAGRMADGVLHWDGRRYLLPTTDGRHAIHGLVYSRPWVPERVTPSEVELMCPLDPAGWPFGGVVRQRFRLSNRSLLAEAEIAAERPMPVAVGWHPWFRRSSGDLRVQLPASEVLETRDLIPTGRRLGVDGITDLRDGPPLGARALDHVYPDAGSPAIIRWPELELRVEFEPPVATVVVHTRPDSFCVEPETAWPNAVALAARGVEGTGLAIVGPGACLRAVMRWRWRARRAGSGAPASPTVPSPQDRCLEPPDCEHGRSPPG